MIARLLLCAAIFAPAAHARTLPDPIAITTATACFTAPGMAAHCAARIAAQIDGAQSTVLVQAYSFTSLPIIRALIEAHGRGVDVRVILDKTQEVGRYTGATPLINAGVQVWIDERPAIAHNKIVVIDGGMVVTGSFNFTASADTRNAENVVFLASPELAEAFSAYWSSRQAVSREMHR